MNKTTKRWRATYEQPWIELCAAEPYKFLAASTTFNGGHSDGSDDNGGGGGTGGGAGTGGDDGEITGAKFFFEDPWDGLKN